MTPPTVRVADPSGRFEMLVPNIWESTSSFAPDLREWKLPVRTFPPASQLLLIGFTFNVYWGEPSMCDLAQCAARLVEALQTSGATVASTLQTDVVGGEPALRIDAAALNERLTAWVVVKGDRYWVTLLSGPDADFDEMMVSVRPGPRDDVLRLSAP